MSYTFPGTPDKGANYMAEEFMAAHGVAPNMDSMRAFSRGILKALSEDELGFNIPPMDADGVSNIVASTAGIFDHGKENVNNASSGSISLSGFSTAPAVTLTAIGADVRLKSAPTSSSFEWESSNGSPITTTIHWIARSI